jgi:hypothetical protein
MRDGSYCLRAHDGTTIPTFGSKVVRLHQDNGARACGFGVKSGSVVLTAQTKGSPREAGSLPMSIPVI